MLCQGGQVQQHLGLRERQIVSLMVQLQVRLFFFKRYKLRERERVKVRVRDGVESQ